MSLYTFIKFFFITFNINIYNDTYTWITLTLRYQLSQFRGVNTIFVE